MATIKAYTDLSQSKKLAEILPIESADMVYTMVNGRCTPFIRIETIEEMDKDDVCAWSLAALIGVLPSSTLDSSDDHHYRLHCNEKFTEWHDNPIDCCVAMINRLHEQMIYDFNNR